MYHARVYENAYKTLVGSGCEAEYSSPTSTEVKTTWSYTSIPNTPSWSCAQLKHRDKFTFILNVKGRDHLGGISRCENIIKNVSNKGVRT
jgi:hypothetical protein